MKLEVFNGIIYTVKNGRRHGYERSGIYAGHTEGL